MAKFVTSLDATAYHDWTAKEGIRDILQNGRDGAIQQGAKLTVQFKLSCTRDKREQGIGVLHVVNDGASLPLRSLLTGWGTKRDDPRLAGKYGEGLPAACLALVRAGHEVIIRTGDEVWRPYIGEHDITRSPVLCFDIAKGRMDRGRISVEIAGIEKPFWRAFKAKFLFLDETDSREDRVYVDSGTLLLGPDYRGDVYVKGIWVMHDPQLEYGYDFKHATTDRDRRMVEQYELLRLAQQVWEEALVARPDIIGRFAGMFDARVKDTEGIAAWNVSGFSAEVKQAIAADFTAKHGTDAIPVLTLADSELVGHFGKTGVVVSKGHLAILETLLGNAATLRAKFASEVVKRYSWLELEDTERQCFIDAMALLNVAVQTTIQEVDIVDFRNPDLQGLHDNGRIQVARKRLADIDDTLETLVHETAHKYGADGSKGHVSTIESTWKAITKHLRTRETK